MDELETLAPGSVIVDGRGRAAILTGLIHPYDRPWIYGDGGDTTYAFVRRMGPYRVIHRAEPQREQL